MWFISVKPLPKWLLCSSTVIKFTIFNSNLLYNCRSQIMTMIVNWFFLMADGRNSFKDTTLQEYNLCTLIFLQNFGNIEKKWINIFLKLNVLRKCRIIVINFSHGNVYVVSIFSNYSMKCSIGSWSIWFWGIIQNKNCTFPLNFISSKDHYR